MYGQLFVSFGWMKYSISICSNSLHLKMKFLGEISFLKALPIWAIPNGSFNLEVSTTCLKSANITWAVSGRRYAMLSLPGFGPTWVWNIRLNCSMSLNSELHFSQDRLFSFTSFIISSVLIPSAATFNFSSTKVSALIFSLHLEHSSIGSWKLAACPDATHTVGCVMIVPSIPTMSSRCWTWNFHQSFFRFAFISEPTGP